MLRGGKAIVFVDPYSELAARSERPTAAPASDLAPLFKAWGVRLLPDTVAADRRNARRVGVPTSSGGTEAMDYIAWLNLRGGELNRDDVITASLNQVTMASAGILEPLPGAATKLEPLITTSPASMKLPADKVAGLPDVAGLLTASSRTIPATCWPPGVTGPVETAFPDAATPKGLRQSVQPINVVIVADTDILDDRFWARSEDFFGQQVVTPVANNADFVANAIDVLGGGEDLVGLRSRGTSVRPFELVQEIQRAADDRYAAEQQALERKLKQTQAKLRELSAGEPADTKAALAPEQARAVERFRAEAAATRRELRGVQAALRQDIERLKLILEFVDIALVPIIVSAAALVLGALRLRRWRRAQPAPA